MTPRENLLRIFRHEMPEWIPIIGACDAYNQPNREGMDPELAEALGEVQGCDEGAITFSRYLDLDLFSTCRAPISGKRPNITTESHREGRDTTITWHTPCGDLEEVTRKPDHRGAPYRIKRLLEKPSDIPALASAFEDETFELQPERVADLQRRRELVGDNGLVALPMPGTPLGMLIRFHAGPENTSLLHADAPDALQDLVQVMAENHLRQFRLATECEADVLLGMDDTSTTTQSPGMFEKYCVDYTNTVAEMTHQSDKYYLHHSCGLIRNLLDLYRQTSMDGVHGFCPPPLGDATIRQGREKLGDQILFAGLIQMFTPAATEDWIRSSVREMFEEAAPGNNIIFGLAGDPLKNMAETKFLREECRQYQSL